MEGRAVDRRRFRDDPDARYLVPGEGASFGHLEIAPGTPSGVASDGRFPISSLRSLLATSVFNSRAIARQ